MTKKKIILLILFVCLLSIYLFQIAFNSKTSTEKIVLSQEITSISISKPNQEPLILTKNEDTWFVNNQKANEDALAEITYALENITLLNKVSSGKDLATYELENAPVVTVFNQDTQLLKITLGKSSATTKQTYIQKDGSPAVYLASQPLQEIMNVSLENLLAKEDTPTEQ